MQVGRHKNKHEYKQCLLGSGRKAENFMKKSSQENSTYGQLNKHFYTKYLEIIRGTTYSYAVVRTTYCVFWTTTIFTPQPLQSAIGNIPESLTVGGSVVLASNLEFASSPQVKMGDDFQSFAD